MKPIRFVSHPMIRQLAVCITLFLTSQAGYAQITGDIEFGGATYFGFTANVRSTSLTGNETMAWISRLGVGHSLPPYDKYHLCVVGGMDFGWDRFAAGIDFGHYFTSPFVTMPADAEDIQRNNLFPHVKYRYRKKRLEVMAGIGLVMSVKSSFDWRPYFEEIHPTFVLSFGLVGAAYSTERRTWL